RADAVVVETPPLLLAGTAIAYARAKGASLVVHVADLWPDSAVELGVLRRPRAIAAARVLERACYPAAAAIACPTEGIEAALAGRSEAGSKVWRIPPSVDTEKFEPRPRPAEGRFRLLYAGTVGMSHGVETLVSAAALLEDQGEVEITIAGDGAEAPALRERLARSGPGNVRMIGAVSPDQIPA